MEAARVQITNVKLDRTATGLDIVLETAEGKPLQVDATKFRREGNSLIAEIPNAVLALPQGQTFVADNPTADIATVQVVQQEGTIRVSVAGKEALPKTEVTLKTGGLAYSLNPEGDEADEEIVVTGAGRGAYRVPNASTATRTDTPIRDIPASIQVVPQQVLRDRNVRNINEAVETVSGVVESGDFFGAPGLNNRAIRGFAQGYTDGGGNLRNGFRDGGFYSVRPIGTVEQVEVLKGPASVLFGALEPGGVVNVTTKQPLSNPYYRLAFEAGNRNFYQPSLDFSGPLTTDKTLLYRFIASYQTSDGVQDFARQNLVTIAPSITWNLSDRTSLNLYYEYAKFTGNPASSSETLLRSNGSFLPRNLYVGYPELNSIDIKTQRFGYTLNHKFSDDWQVRNGFAVSLNNFSDNRAYPGAILDDRFLTSFEAYDLDYSFKNYFGQIDLLGKFKTGSVSHQVLMGFDFNRYSQNYQGFFNGTDLPPLDILSPNYDVPRPELFPFFKNDETIQSYGIYLQDQINLSDSLKLLVGGRYDWVSYENEIADFGVFGNTIDDPMQNDGAFSPRIGLVYQPSDTVSLYANYSRSFRQTTGFNPDGRAFEPTRGTQYEAGIKVDFLDGKLSTTLAAYQITKTNVTTPDPDNPLFSIQVGEQRSRGIELDVVGEIVPGWKVTASYAYTNAVVTEDNSIPIGSRLRNVPQNQASLWTTYEIQKGDLKGLGFGLGLFYVGERQANFGAASDPFQLASYLRTDAALYYRRGGFNAAINVRNLFDIDYAPYGFARNNVGRGAPFTIVGSISWEF
jgi:iron complex outermembrane receptor protein